MNRIQKAVYTKEFREEAVSQCARVFMQRLDKNSDPLVNWTRQMLARRHSNVVACALVNKFARIAWAIAAHNTTFNAGAAAMPA